MLKHLTDKGAIMRRHRIALLPSALVATLLSIVCVSLLHGQTEKDLGQLQLLPELGSLAPSQAGAVGGELQVSARFRASQVTGRIDVIAQVKDGWHVYSLSQAKGGPTPTSIKLQASQKFRLSGSFRPDKPPSIREVEVFDVPIEEHGGRVVWSAPIEMMPGVNPETVVIQGSVTALVCSDSGGCVPVDVKFQAGYDGPLPAQPAKQASAGDAERLPKGVQPPGTHALVSGTIQPQSARPGETIEFRFTVVPDDGWHVYAYEPTKGSGFVNPTLIHISLPGDEWRASNAVASVQPHAVPSPIPNEPDVLQHEQAVTWTVNLRVPNNAAAGTYPVRGMIGLQTCRNVCDFPAAMDFETSVKVVPEGTTTQVPVAIRFVASKTGYAQVAELVDSAGLAEPASPDGDVDAGAAAFDASKLIVDRKDRGLAYILPIAFVGGFILNFMPCVLPVIGLKIMSFAEQAGQNRGRIFALNIWYSLGMLTVFWVLATLASVASLGWGEQFNYDGFNIPLISVVFVMGLSFLGVWELPIPGFATSGKATEMADQEGALGALCKGVITTVLATPCSGPALAAALAWAAGKPPSQVYLVFTMIGLGMASPYLLIGAFPHLIRFLPRPGAWMDTLKQMLGFVLLGTVVYLLTVIQWVHVIPTVALLIGFWAACWWIGRVPLGAELDRRIRAWAVAVVIVLLVGSYSFADRFNFGGKTYYGLRGTMVSRFNKDVDTEVAKRGLEQTTPTSTHTEYELPWEPFSFEGLARMTSEQKTVLVDFTADWCLTCKTLEHFVLNTEPIRELVDEHQVVTLVADWGDRDPKIGDLLRTLGGAPQIPLLAIFPAGRPNNPIVLNTYTQSQLISALSEAVGDDTSTSRGVASVR